MLSARTRLLLTRILTVTVVVVTMGGNLAFVTAPPAPLAPTESKLVATWETTTGGSLFSPGSNYAATGLVACLIFTSSLTVNSSLPYPDSITSDAVVGCDTLLTPGTTPVIEYNAANDPKFQAFVTKFTNATDDTLYFYAAQVNDELMQSGLGTGGGGCESRFGRHKVKNCNVKNLLTGYTIDFIRMTASNIVSTVSADGQSVSFSVDVLWEAYGHR